MSTTHASEDSKSKGGLRIYFAGSIRGESVDKSVLRALIGHLQTHGTVLTEHVGNDVCEQLTDVQIFERDVEWLLSSDVMVAECSGASLGVGYELARAQMHGIPTLVLSNFTPESGKRLSAMIKGCAHFTCKEYQDVEAAAAIMDAFVGSQNTKQTV